MEKEQKVQTIIAIYEAMEKNWEYSYLRKAAALCGFTSFDSARPQTWSDEMRRQGCGDLINGVVWDCSTDKFGKPINMHAELYRRFSDLLQDADAKAGFAVYMADYCENYHIREYVK